MADPALDVPEPAWHAKETVRATYDIDSIPTALQTTSSSSPTTSKPCPPEIHKLGRTITRWPPPRSSTGTSPQVTNGPTEALNKRIKRAAFGFRNFANYRIRALLYAEKPNWDLLATVTPH